MPGIPYKWEQLSEEEIRQAYENSTNLTQFSQQLGYREGRSKKFFEKLFTKYNLDAEKFNYHAGKDITGQIFGYLEALEIDWEKTKETHRRYWKCLCHGCNKNNIVSVRLGNLTSGSIQSCGCLAGKSRRIDLSGQVFGYLQAIEIDEEESSIKRGKNGVKKIYWKCKCLNCNRPDLVSVLASHLKSGHTTSCGCKKGTNYSVAETNIEQILIKNQIDFEKQYSFEDLLGTTGKLRFDFAIFNKDKLCCLLEYNGIQHYEPRERFGGEEGLKTQQERDQKKQVYCTEKNIPLIILNSSTGYKEEVIMKEIHKYMF